MRTLILPFSHYRPRAVRLPRPYTLRPCRTDDAEAIGALHHTVYATGRLDQTIAEFEGSFRGEYGVPIDDTSLAVEHGGQLVAALLTVYRAPWPDIPDCPWVNDLLTHPAHRRRGLAGAMLLTALNALADRGSAAIALRVKASNQPALALYGSLGFADWDGTAIAPTADDQ